VKRVLSILTGLSLIALLLGMLATILRYPVNTFYVVISGISASVLLLVRYATKVQKRLSDTAKYAGLSIYVLSRAWTVAHWKFSRELSWVGLALILLWIAWRYIEDENGWWFLRTYFKSGILMLGVSISLLAVIFKILHWMGADILLISGFLILAVWFFAHFVIGAFGAENEPG